MLAKSIMLLVALFIVATAILIYLFGVMVESLLSVGAGSIMLLLIAWILGKR
jgi:hypothetical protein